MKKDVLESGMDRSVKFLNDRKRETEMGHPLSLNGDVDGEPLCLAMTCGLTAPQRGFNRGYGSTNSSSDVSGVGGNVPNCEHGLESEDETDEVGEVQERSEVEIWMGGRGNL